MNCTPVLSLVDPCCQLPGYSTEKPFVVHAWSQNAKPGSGVGEGGTVGEGVGAAVGVLVGLGLGMGVGVAVGTLVGEACGVPLFA